MIYTHLLHGNIAMALPPNNIQVTGLYQNPESRDLWSTCPSDIHARCFRSQQDFVDNSAAACVSTSCRDAFIELAEQIKVQHNCVNEGSWSPTYLQQFTGLQKLELASGPNWQQQDSSITSRRRCRLHAIFWTKMIQSIPTSCWWLRLDGLRWHGAVADSLSTLGQLSNLQSLYIHSHHRGDVSLEAIASLMQLQLLSLVGLSIKTSGGSEGLPTGIMNLQLKSCHSVPVDRGFCLPDMALFPKLTSLGFSYCCISFGEPAKVVDLRRLKVLVLEGATAEGSAELIVASLSTAQQLQDLNLRAFRFESVHRHEPHLKLGKMLSSLQS